MTKVTHMMKAAANHMGTMRPPYPASAHISLRCVDGIQTGSYCNAIYGIISLKLRPDSGSIGRPTVRRRVSERD